MVAPITIALPPDTLAWLRQLADDTRVSSNRLAFYYSGQQGQQAFDAFCAQREHAFHAARVVAAIDTAEGRPNMLAEALARIAETGGAAHA